VTGSPRVPQRTLHRHSTSSPTLGGSRVHARRSRRSPHLLFWKSNSDSSDLPRSGRGLVSDRLSGTKCHLDHSYTSSRRLAWAAHARRFPRKIYRCSDESVRPAVCYGQTDSPHQSGTSGYFGNVNVHGSTTCSIPLPITVSTTLERQRCIWFICWWSGAGSGFNSLVGTFVSTIAAAGCAKEWWIGTSYHTALFLSGQIASGTSRGVGYLSYCF
jgi:hypothetical protein